MFKNYYYFWSHNLSPALYIVIKCAFIISLFSEQNCRDRWKNIRTAFGRSLKPPKSGSGKSKKPYYLSEHLYFLRPYMKGPSSSGNIMRETEEVIDSQMTVDDDQLSDTVDTETEIVEPLQHSETDETLQPSEIDEPLQPSETEEPFQSSEIVVPLQRKRKKGTSQEEDQLRNDANNAFVEWVAMKKQSATKTMENRQRDSDWLFLESLLPDMKKLDNKRRRTVKMKMMQLIYEQLDEAERETSAPFSPWSSSSSSTAHYPVSISTPTAHDMPQPTQYHFNASTYTDL